MDISRPGSNPTGATGAVEVGACRNLDPEEDVNEKSEMATDTNN
jgi:hypothetical protein